MATSPNSQQLHIKSYFARSVQDAIEHARGEMGADALLLNSRPAPPEARYLGEYEVVFGTYPEQRPAPAAVAAATPSVPAPMPAAAMPVASSVGANADVEDLRRSINELRTLLTRPAPVPIRESLRTRQPELVPALLRAGVEIDVAADIEDAVVARLNQQAGADGGRARRGTEWDPEAVLAETTAEIESRIEIAPPIGRITALVGPPGTGKTTTLIKMAVNQTIATGRSVQLISADWHRIGAAEQFRTYATILGVPFQTVDTAASLAQAIDNASSAAHIFIDTSGLSPALIDELGMDLAGFLSRRQDIDTHLVLTSAARQIDLEKAAERYSVYDPKRLIFTHLDETESAGPLFGVALRRSLPIAYLCQGQLIPEDIEPATKRRISESLVQYLPGNLRPAA